MKNKGFTRLVDFGKVTQSRSKRALPKFTTGFTIIEMIIYVALFSIIMGSLVATAFYLSKSAIDTSGKVTTEEEINFVLKKFDWAFTGAESDSIDVGTPNQLSLENESVSPDPIVIRLNGENDIEMEIEGDVHLLTTKNVSVEDLNFSFDSDTRMLSAALTIDGVVSEISKFLKI